ncbi:MAG: hypothetical protein ACOCSK_02945 [Rhodothermales bacterium]
MSSRPEDDARRASTPHLRQLIVSYLATASRDYLIAGMPFGDSERAMLLWFQYGQYTTAN